ncbi:MAG: hypothetical protein HY865_08970 [Chloroflexi bacterium]|nr:hypothetical protein [Chloroflexota bacterium]
MARTSPDIEVKETYSDLSAAQQTAPVMLACDMAELIKQMIEQGKLEVKDGQIVPKGR